MVLDEGSRDCVITALLDRLSYIESDNKRCVDFHLEFVPALNFPNGFHDYEVLYSLEGRYA